MSLSEDVRGELAAIEPRKACCRLAELSALVRTAGSVHLRGGGRIGVHLELASAAVARRTFALLRAYGVPCEIHTYRRRSFDRATRFQIHVDDDAPAVQALNEAGILGDRLEPLERPPSRVTARSCCRAAYLRGAFLAAGSVSGPRSPHFELRTAMPDAARFLAGLAGAERMPMAVAERRGHALAYAKGTETIADLLAFVGAHDAALVFGERAVIAATRARANRLANADHANIGRASRAAEAHVRAIERLRSAGRLDHVSPELRELADLRLRHPTLSLRELARRCSPPTTKAAAHRRLAKLQRLAEG
ncbi:MAG TPA: DNA-binding protein WhiA [Gaiellaceae bacterium]|nr:DNA-binding protein WhiA [Gaiellaceae bacterium]